MLDRLSDAAPIEAARAGSLLHFFWMAQGAYSEEQERLRGLLARDSLPQQSRAALLVRPRPTSRCAWGEWKRQGPALARRWTLSEPGTEPHWMAVAEFGLPRRSSRRHGGGGSARPAGARGGREARRRRAHLGDRPPRHHPHVGQPHRGGAIDVPSDSFTRPGGAGCKPSRAIGLADLGWLDLLEHDYESARAAYAAARTQLHGARQVPRAGGAEGLGLASLGLGQRDEARAAFAELLELALAGTQTYSAYVAGALSGIAPRRRRQPPPTAPPGSAAPSPSSSSDADVVLDGYSRADELERHFERPLVALLGEGAWEREETAGSTMTLEQAIALARSLSGQSARAVAAES